MKISVRMHRNGSVGGVTEHTRSKTFRRVETRFLQASVSYGTLSTLEVFVHEGDAYKSVIKPLCMRAE